MTPAEFDALFTAVRSSVFRLEVRQEYAVSAEDASLIAFRMGRARPERSVRTSTWPRRIAATTLAGVDWLRIRVVTRPLTEYVRWELLGYVESQAAGERIDVTERTDIDGPDFWLLDADTDAAVAVLMHYTDDGRVADRELVTDRAIIAGLVGRRDDATTGAIRLNEFLARQDSRDGAQQQA